MSSLGSCAVALTWVSSDFCLSDSFRFKREPAMAVVVDCIGRRVSEIRYSLIFARKMLWCLLL